MTARSVATLLFSAALALAAPVHAAGADAVQRIPLKVGLMTVRAVADTQGDVDVYGIYFAFCSDRLRSDSDRVLQEVADLLKKHGDRKLQIDGHTDNIGGDDANLDLSRRRAAAVKTALVQRYAIAAPRLSSGGPGEGRPKDRNDTIEGRALNRRVELRRL